MNKEWIKEIKRTIQHILIDKDMTIKDLADKMGIHQSNLTKKLNGKLSLKIDTLVEIFHHLGYSVNFELKPQPPKEEVTNE